MEKGEKALTLWKTLLRTFGYKSVLIYKDKIKEKAIFYNCSEKKRVWMGKKIISAVAFVAIAMVSGG